MVTRNLVVRLADIAGADVESAVLTVTGPVVRDLADNVLHVGDVRHRITGQVTRIPLLVSGTGTTNPDTFQYRFRLTWDGGSLPEFGAEVLQSDTELEFSTIAAIDPADPVYFPRVISISEVFGLLETLIAFQTTIDTKADQGTADTTYGRLAQPNTWTTNQIVARVQVSVGNTSSSAASTISATTQEVLPYNATAAAIVATLPAAGASNKGLRLTLKKIDATANTVTAQVASTGKIDGAATYGLTAQNKYVTVVSSGVAATGWWIISNN